MDKYIEREAVINDIGELFTICYETLPNECGHHFVVEEELQHFLDFVRSLPVADVAPVVRATNQSTNGFLCSACSFGDFGGFHGYVPNYCPNCGAKIGGDGDV